MGWMNALSLYRLRLELCLWWNSLVGGFSFHDRCTVLHTCERSCGSEGIFTASPCLSLAGRGSTFFAPTVFAVFQPRHVSFWYMGRRLILSVGTVVGVWNGKLFRTFLTNYIEDSVPSPRSVFLPWFPPRRISFDFSWIFRAFLLWFVDFYYAVFGKTVSSLGDASRLLALEEFSPFRKRPLRHCGILVGHRSLTDRCFYVCHCKCSREWKPWCLRNCYSGVSHKHY
jgi:hypothetical protein